MASVVLFENDRSNSTTALCCNCNAAVTAAPAPSLLVDQWCRTRTIVTNFSFTWAIDNFSFCNENNVLSSSTFTSGCNNDTSEWCLRVNPKGEAESEGHLSVFLVLLSSDKPEVAAKFAISILNAKGEKGETGHSGKAYRFIRGGVWGMPRFIQLESLHNPVNKLLPNDCLTIVCEVSAAVDQVVVSGRSSNVQVQIPEELVQNFAALIGDPEFSDITLAVGGKEVHGHKAILAARSVVFAAMFSHLMKESVHNRVVIEDIGYEVFEEMLKYIYTGQSPNMEKMADELLAAANKYYLSGLKAMCEVFLCSTVSVENATDLLLLADMHSAKLLKARVLRLIQSQAEDVMLTSSWKLISLTHPNLIIEALAALASQKVPPVV